MCVIALVTACIPYRSRQSRMIRRSRSRNMLFMFVDVANNLLPAILQSFLCFVRPFRRVLSMLQLFSKFATCR